MSLTDFLKRIDDEVTTVNSSDFEIEIYDTEKVPSFDDSYITYDNLDDKVKRCKRLESCVLYVDIRGSANLNASKRAWTLARVYSSFVRSMIAAARYYGGHVRNIIGDRVMVIFDKENCFTNAVNTAVLMNTIAHHIISKRVSGFDFKCGIGIDYGQMLVTKAGAIRRGEEREFYRSLVWLGRPANVASRLTDIANKTTYSTTTTPIVMEGHKYSWSDDWTWYEWSHDYFLDQLEVVYSSHQLKHKDSTFRSFFKSSRDSTTSFSYRPILMTDEVYQGYKRNNPNADAIKKGWWVKQYPGIPEYKGDIYGSSLSTRQKPESAV